MSHINVPLSLMSRLVFHHTLERNNLHDGPWLTRTFLTASNQTSEEKAEQLHLHRSSWAARLHETVPPRTERKVFDSKWRHESGHQLPLKLWFQPRRFLWTADTSRRILQENSSTQISCHPDERKSSSSFSSPPGGLLQQEVSPVRGFVFHRNIRLLSSTFVSFGEK